MKILAEQITAVLRAEPWVSSHTLLQRCASARTGDDVTAALRVMERAKSVQTRTGQFGLIWALAGAEPPADSAAPPSPHVPGTHPMRLPALPQPSESTSMRTTPHGQPTKLPTPAMPGSTRAKLLECLARMPEPVTTRVIADAMKISPAAANYCLKCELQLGNVRRTNIGNERETWQLTNAPSAVVPSAQPAVASNSGSSSDGACFPSVVTEPSSPRDGLSDSEREQLRAVLEQATLDPPAMLLPPTSVLADEASFRCALWSDGQLEICSGDVNLVLPKSLTEKLCAYLDGVLMDGVTA